MSWKIGQAASGSEAPRSARRESEMLGAIGMGISEETVGWESWIDSRMGLARDMAERREAV